MNSGFLQPWLDVTSVCLTSLLILSIIVAIRVKSFQAGMGLFLLISLVLVLPLLFILLYENYLPIQTQKTIFNFSFSSLVIGVFTIGLIYWLNTKKGGRIVWHSEKANTNKSNSILHIVLILINLLVISLHILILGNSHLLSGAVLLLILAFTVITKIFLSKFEIRENGFIAHGKVIPFTNIEHAEWENLLDKTKLKLQLKNTGRVVIIKTPWEMIVPVDDYIKKNFPRP